MDQYGNESADFAMLNGKEVARMTNIPCVPELSLVVYQI